MAWMRDLIAIPERVHQGDFVLQLSRGVTEPDQTLRDYVVTPQLVDMFSNALGFIQLAVQTGASKAAYLHGAYFTPSRTPISRDRGQRFTARRTPFHADRGQRFSVMADSGSARG